MVNVNLYPNMENHKLTNLKNQSKDESTLPEVIMFEINQMKERVDSMNQKELYDKLKHFFLDSEGCDNTLRNRLIDNYEKIIIANKDLCLSNELLPYYIIVDFEATCEEVNPPNYRHEIIEFPAVMIDSKKLEIVDCFQMYCRPEINPKITNFCTELTGITQEQVDSAEPFEKVLEHFKKWLAHHNLGKKYKFAIVTDGPLDMSRFLYSQCHYSNVKFPKWAKNWVNLRKAFSKFYQCERICLKNMLQFLNMEFVGRPHCGLDDAKNIARILLKMIYDGANIQINERITVSKKYKEKRESRKHSENSGNCISNPTEKLRIEAHCAPIYYLDSKMPVYKKTRRDRLIGEVQTAKKLFKNSNLSEKNSKKENNKKKVIRCYWNTE